MFFFLRKIEKDISSYTLQDKLDFLEKDSPELFAFLEEMQERKTELQTLMDLIQNRDQYHTHSIQLVQLVHQGLHLHF